MNKLLKIIGLTTIIMIATTSFAAYVVGDEADNFTLNDSSGVPVTLYDYTGKIVILNFWQET